MFIAYHNANDMIIALRPVIDQIKRHSANLADQLERAATSVMLNIKEGARRGGKDRKRHYRIAAGSANEVEGALDVAAAWGWVNDCATARSLVDRELRLLRGLCR